MGGKMKIFKFFLVISSFFLSSIWFAGTLVINSNQSDPRANEVMHAYIKAFDEAHPDITVVVNDIDTEEYKV